MLKKTLFEGGSTIILNRVNDEFYTKQKLVQMEFIDTKILRVVKTFVY